MVERAQGVWVYDTSGRRYLDCLSAYSALNQGHAHPTILAALIEQAQRVTLTSRAFHNDQLPLLCCELAELTGLDVVLPMNTGAEAVETAIKGARAVGLPLQADSRGRGRDDRVRWELPWAHDDDCGFLGGGWVSAGIWVAVYAGVCADSRLVTWRLCGRRSRRGRARFWWSRFQCEAGIVIPPAGYLEAAAELCREQRGVVCGG